MSRLRDLLREKVVVLDGGLATTLESYGMNLNNSLWSASALLTDPETVARAHKAFVSSGCDLISTASYQLTLQARPDDGEALLRRSVSLARESGAMFVAASIGSYGAFLADGSEYDGSYGERCSEAFLQDFHRERIRMLAPGVDVLLFETFPCLAEARAVLRLLSPSQFAIVSFQCRDHLRLASGELFSDAVALCNLYEQCLGVGVNCVPPGGQHKNDCCVHLYSLSSIIRSCVGPHSGCGRAAASRTGAVRVSQRGLRLRSCRQAVERRRKELARRTVSRRPRAACCRLSNRRRYVVAFSGVFERLFQKDAAGSARTISPPWPQSCERANTEVQN